MPYHIAGSKHDPFVDSDSKIRLPLGQVMLHGTIIIYTYTFVL